MSSTSIGLFYALITISQQSQPSCLLDSFMFLNRKHDLEAISLMSSCLGINLGLFPIHGLETHAYIFNECKIQSLCTTVDSTDANIIVWSTFPKNSKQLNLGNILKVLPVSDSNRTGLVAIFSKDHSHFKAVLPNIQLSLLGSEFQSVANVNEEELTFSKSPNLFKDYRAKLSGRIKQVNKWKKVPIEIHGIFSNRPGNIPHLLCHQITKYVDIFYNRTKIEMNNTEVVYNRAVSQYTKANITYNKHKLAKIMSSDLVQQMEEEYKRVNDIQYLITENLQVANDEVKNLQKDIDNLCTIKQCPEVCIPQPVCEACNRTITIPVQGTCIFPCTKAENITVITGSERVRRWEYIPQQKCNTNPSCQVLQCMNTVTCETDFISQPVEYDRYETETIVVNINTNCDKPCSETVATAPVTALCCADSICNSTEQDVECLRESQRCAQTRTIIYSNLDDVESNATEFLRSLDEAKRNTTITKLRLSRVKADAITDEKRFNQSKQAFTNADLTLQIATASFEKIRKKNQLAKLEKVKKFKVCGFTSRSFFRIKSVSFDTTIINESPKQLAVDVVIFIASQNITVTETLFVDFNNVNASLKEGAVSIIEKLVLSQNTLSKRHSKRDVNGTGPRNNELYFQQKCVDTKNIVDYIKELNASIFTVAASTISSVFSWKNNVLELSKLINYSSNILNEELTINYQGIANLINKNLKDFDSADVKESEEIDELIKLVQEHLLSSQQLESEIGITLYQSWQAKMEDLHNQTESAAAFPCIGFSGCLQTVVDTLNDLVSDTPFNNGILSDFSYAAQSFMDLVLLQNYSIVSAVTNTQKIYDIASSPVITDYWCASVPRIIVHPVKYLNTTENAPIALSCKAEVDQFISYQWKKDGVQLVDQKNSTLVLTNVTLSDSGNYTCVATNQVGSTNSFNATVEVLRFPSFLLEPNDVYEYLGNLNGATFRCNASGFPYPGYRWYFQPKGEEGFNEIPNSDQNVLVIVPPLPKHEGSYYCEAFIGDESVQSKAANLTVLHSTVVQIAQTVYLNFSYLSKIGETEIHSSGSGSGLTLDEDIRLTDYINSDFSGSGEGSGMNKNRNITITPYTKLALQRNLLNVLNTLMSFGSTTVENISLNFVNPFNLTISFTLYSHNVIYSEASFSKINQLAPQAMVEWAETWQKLQELLSISAFIITDAEYEYESLPSSLEVDMLQFICPAGKGVSSTNNLICGKFFLLLCNT